MTLDYPVARIGDDAVDLHGRSIPDPYRWLETPDSAETRTWVEAQAELAAHELSQLGARDEIRARLTELMDYPRLGPPRRVGERWFQWRNSGLQNQAVLHVMTSATDEGRVLLDPNTLSADGTEAVGGVDYTADGGLVVYAVSSAGSDWRSFRVRDVETGEDLPDHILWSKLLNASWAPDGSGFYYCAYPFPAEGRELLDATIEMTVKFHRLGTAQSDDRIVYERPAEKVLIAPEVTHDGRFVAVTIVQGAESRNELHVLDLENESAGWQPIAPVPDGLYGIIGNEGDTFYLTTSAGASRRRIIRHTLGKAVEDAETIIPESEHQLIGAWHIGGRLVVQHLVHAIPRLTVYSTDGELLHTVALPANSALTELQGSVKHPLLHLGTTGFTDPGTIWSHDVETGVTTLVTAPQTTFDTGNFVTEQVFATSKDGTQIPVLLVRRKDLQPTGDVPVWQYAYGGFNIPLAPAFSAPRAAWLERGGMFVMATLRGGGEYGTEWWDGGRLANKQNCFDDFCAVSELLTATGWSSPAHTAINGGSNGGLLVGACVTQRPELFGAVVCEVGVLDMLRFHHFTVGHAWTTDYGNPDDAEAFDWLVKYSPLHNLRPGTAYPPVLVMTGDHDDRVVPSHSYKFAAALQAAQAADNPVLLRVELSTGHGLGKPTAKILDERADMLAFMERHVGRTAP